MKTTSAVGVPLLALLASACSAPATSSSSSESTDPSSTAAGEGSTRGSAPVEPAARGVTRDIEATRVSGAAASSTSFSAAAPTPPSDTARFYFVQSTPSGYVLSELNEPTTQTVPKIDLASVDANSRQLSAALAQPKTIAALGVVNAGTFTATSVYQALPDAAPMSGNAYFRVTLPPIHHGAGEVDEVNANETVTFDHVDLSAATRPFVDGVWLAAQVVNGNAVVAGAIHDDEKHEVNVLVADAIYLRIPDNTTCAAQTETCSAPTIPSYERDATTRCLVASGCTKPGICPQFIPYCEPGYTLTRWTGPAGCSQFACDPDFDPPPAQ